MKHLTLLSAAVLAAAACSDETDPARTAPTAPAPTLSRSRQTPKGLSTVCMSYMTQLANAEEKLEKKPADIVGEKLAKLEKRVEALDKLAAEACG